MPVINTLIAWVSVTVEQALDRFSEHVTLVGVSLSNENSGKHGQRD